MAQDYTGMAIGVFELESECICFVALDAAAKAAEIPAFDLNTAIKEVLGATSREQLQQIFAQRKSMLAGDDLKAYKQAIAKRDKELSDEAKAE